MKLLRISASALALSLLAMLAACGGGGGGGSTPPTSPGGGGPPPSSSPTSAPTTKPTSSPTTSPTSAPSGSVAVSSTDYDAYDGPTWGQDNWQTNGVTSSEAGDGDIKNDVGTGQSTDGLNACALSSESQMTANNYHVHTFLGIYVNGTAMAIPDAIGMANPGSSEPILTFTCAYSIHTHGASGIIHVEDPTIAGTWQNTQPPAQYNLQSLFDIWGQSLNSVAGASGMPTIYVGDYSGKDSAGRDLVNSYSVYTGSASSLLLKHHRAIFLVYGALPTSTNGNPCPTGSNGCLPQVSFGLSN
ncbi:MAG TPA: hypothetical protein VKT72_04430 [Candidatus Baltobacteraceae bacterium]|nr:hypothetical protein [Candidatus Baltobacteraceae bacterium]